MVKPADDTGHYRKMREMRERETIAAAKALAKVHHENGTINAAGRALAELRGAVAVLEAAEHQAAGEPVDPRIRALRMARDHIARKLDLAKFGQGVLLTNEDAALLVASLGVVVT